jgi:predicted PurR-regulated permease PerM
MATGDDQVGQAAGVGSTISVRQVFGWCLAGAVAVLLVFLAARAMYAMQALLVQIAIAAFLAISLDPVVRWMISRRLRRPVAVAILSVLALGVAAAITWAITPPLVSQANELTSDFPGYLDRLRDQSPTLRGLEERFGLQPHIDTWVRELPDWVGAQAIGFVRQFLGALFSVLLVVVITAYLLLDLPRLRRGLVRLFPIRQRSRVAEVVNLVIDKVGSYMIGNLLISAIAGVTAFVALSALGVPYALPLALLVAVTDLIPLIGATLGAAICLVVSAATNELWPTTVLVGAFFLVYQQVENYVIAPRVIRSSVNISSIAVLLAAMIGASVLGLVGAVMAIPIAATITVIVSDRLRARDNAADQALEASAAVPDPALRPPVLVEVILLSAEPEQPGQLRYRSESAVLTAGPDDLAASLAELDHPHAILHSTSWRFADDVVVLTYAALPDPDPHLPTRPVPLGQVVTSGDPEEPDPQPDLDNVAAHACRHLAFLMKTDSAVAEAIGQHSGVDQVLQALTPAAAGQLATLPSPALASSGR